MLEILQFIFGSFWTWSGTVFLVVAVMAPLSNFAAAAILRDK